MKPRTAGDDKVRFDTILTEAPDVGFHPSGTASSSSKRAPDVEIVEKDDEEARPDGELCRRSQKSKKRKNQGR